MKQSKPQLILSWQAVGETILTSADLKLAGSETILTSADLELAGSETILTLADLELAGRW